MGKAVLIIETMNSFLSTSEISNVKVLLESGYEVHYASNRKEQSCEFYEQELYHLGIHWYQIDFPKNLFQFVLLARCIKKICKIIEEREITLIHCYALIGSVVGRLAFRMSRRKPYVVYTTHGFCFYKGAPLFNWILYYPIEYLLSKWTDCMVTINKEDYTISKKMSFKKCIQVSGIGIDLKRYYPQNLEVQNRKDKKFRIISVGELNKNHRIVIKAIEMLNDTDIVYEIYGSGPEKKNLEKLICSCGLANQVFLKDFSMNIEKYLWEADCCVIPSSQEGVGVAALEAMACGVPLIVADNRSTREFTRNEINSLVCEPNNINQFAEAVRRIKENPKLANWLMKHAYETVQNFSEERSTEIIRKIYEEI